MNMKGTSIFEKFQKVTEKLVAAGPTWEDWEREGEGSHQERAGPTYVSLAFFQNFIFENFVVGRPNNSYLQHNSRKLNEEKKLINNIGTRNWSIYLFLF